MEIRWNRIFGFLALILLTAGALKLHKNADTVRYKWHSMIESVSDAFRSDPIMAILYLILFFEIAVVLLWVLSRVINWYRR